MRTIKFRAWHVKRKTMFDMVKSMWSSDGYSPVVFEIDEITHKHSLHLMQYTGLKDKNGVEIYEGDIIKSYYNYYGTVGEVSAVEFHADSEYGAGVSPFGDGEYGHPPNECEIIGNIYENPELLEDK
jgi:uncharacterized phage protein (TIGR01671 family)